MHVSLIFERLGKDDQNTRRILVVFKRSKSCQFSVRECVLKRFGNDFGLFGTARFGHWTGTAR